MALKKKRNAERATSREIEPSEKNSVQTGSYRQPRVCFNLALLINFAEPAQTFAKPRFTSSRYSKENVVIIAHRTRRERHEGRPKTPADASKSEPR
jgi:hypothetical protein